MLNDLLDIFLGMYYEYIPEDYPLRDYFTSIICVCVVAAMLLGSFSLLLVVVNSDFQVYKR